MEDNFNRTQPPRVNVTNNPINKVWLNQCLTECGGKVKVLAYMLNNGEGIQIGESNQIEVFTRRKPAVTWKVVKKLII